MSNEPKLHQSNADPGVSGSVQARHVRTKPDSSGLGTRRMITVAIDETATDRRVAIHEHPEVQSPFHDAMAILLTYLDTVYKSKSRGTREGFTVFVMVDRDNPFRVEFEVCYEPKKWRKIYRGAPQFNEAGTEPYQLTWFIPEDIDAFPSTDSTAHPEKTVWTACPQHRRFDSYKGITDTFTNRVRCRLNRRLGWEESAGPFSFANDEPEWEPIDLVERLAEGDSNEQVAKWWADQEHKKSRGVSMTAASETVGLMRQACSREIAILSTVHAMERAQASCADIVAKAKEMLQEYDKDVTTQKLGMDRSPKI